MKIRLGSMVGDALRSLFRRPVTQRYPFERLPAPERLRGVLQWDADKCTGCALCVKDCPAQAIEIEMVDKATKQVVMRYHVDRCTYCAQCLISCRQDALSMAHDEWELASADKAPFMITHGDPADVERLAARAAAEAPKG